MNNTTKQAMRSLYSETITKWHLHKPLNGYLEIGCFWVITEGFALYL